MIDLKYLSVPDFHFSFSADRWEASVACGVAVQKAAEKYKVDFIAVPGDWFDNPIMATSKGGLEVAKSIMREWLKTCPVVAIEGTPSHDGPGCYGIFEEMGLVLLMPGKVYGFFKGEKSIIELNHYEAPKPSAILFGFPELNKTNIQAKLNLPAEQANAEATKLFKDYIIEFVTPRRMKYEKIPAIGLLHGNVTDSISREHENDQILSRAEILISTEVLERARLDYWNLGHIHKPWMSKKIPASYAGNPVYSWNETDFLPAFELIEFANDEWPRVHDVIRIPYGTPERRKIKKGLEAKDPAIAYWLERTDPDDTLPEAVHPWSRTTDKLEKRETQRITAEEAEKINCLWDLFKKMDPKVDKRIREKVELIQEVIKPESTEKKRIVLKSIEVAGSILFEGQKVEFPIETLCHPGLNSIHGEVGEGKSSLLAFCSPYPVVVGKETQSGRASAIKDFFSEKESFITKTFEVNGEEHVHHITIKGAHTNSPPKVECFLTVNGSPVLDKVFFDEMMSECEKRYGSFEDYRITTFYEQPQQSPKNQSGLMTASVTEARNVVQNIAGVDRESEKRFALDKVLKTESEISTTETKIETLQEAVGDPAEIKEKISALKSELASGQKEVESLVEKGNVAKKEFDIINEKVTQNRSLMDAKASKTTELITVEKELEAIERSINEQKHLSANLQTFKDDLARAEQIREKIGKLEKELIEIQSENRDRENTFLLNQSAYDKKINAKRSAESSVRYAEERIKTIRSMIEQATQPCEYCGKISSSAQKVIDEHQEQITKLEAEIKEAKEQNIDIGPAPEEPEYLTFKDEDELRRMRNIVIQDPAVYKQKIQDAEVAEKKMDILKAKQESKKEFIDSLQKDITNLSAKIDETLHIQFFKAEELLKKCREEYTEAMKGVTIAETELKNLKEKLDSIALKQDEIKGLQEYHVNLTLDLEDWKYIATMLSANKIPALELDIIIDSIDAEATRIIEPFFEGRYTFMTQTQKQGKKSAVDKFDIMIHDGLTGKQRSMFFKNPGHKSFFSDAYIKALIRKRKEKMNVSYSPIIIDEADAPISPNQIPVYYDIQNKYFMDETVLIVTHSTDAQEFIQNKVEMKELKNAEENN